MPSGSYRQANIRCPFYKWDDGKKRITCEGIVEGSSLAQFYHRKRDFEKQIDIFCSNHFEKCEIHGMLMTKYE